MHFLAISLLVVAVSASPAVPWKRQAKIIPVVVGGQQDVFIPNRVSAAPGDIVQFQFSNGNHTVTQSTADKPCTALQETDPKAVHSGHIPFGDGQEMVGTFNMPIQNTDPMFLFCATGPHCTLGQVMMINPSSDLQIVDLAKAAQAAGPSVDGKTVVGGTVGQIPLANAAFTPAPPEDKAAAAPPPAAPPAGDAMAPAAPPAAKSSAAPTALPSGVTGVSGS